VVFSEILKGGGQRRADVIVIGTNGRTGLDEMLMGSTAERV